jgi:AcrR family transcriptional regulator
MANITAKKRTQAERRAESQQAVLESACKLFGAQGYTDTSLEDIAADCGLTIRPIYHYFGNKKALFAAVNDVMEQRVLESMELSEGLTASIIVSNWRVYLDLCEDPAFLQIVLVDAPNVLGRKRFTHTPITEKVRSALQESSGGNPEHKYRGELLNALIMGAFSEVALVVAGAEDTALARREAEQLMAALFSALPDV